MTLKMIKALGYLSVLIFAASSCGKNPYQKTLVGVVPAEKPKIGGQSTDDAQSTTESQQETPVTSDDSHSASASDSVNSDSQKSPNAPATQSPTPTPTATASPESLVQSYCAGCHMPGSVMASVPLHTSDEIRKRSKDAIREIEEGTMPPGNSTFKSTDDGKSVLEWLKAGAPGSAELTPTATPTPTPVLTTQPTVIPTVRPTTWPTTLPTARPTLTPTVISTPTKTPTPMATATPTPTSSVVTFAQIQPILQNRCSSCHASGRSPSPITSQTVVDQNKAAIRSEVSSKSMPPGGGGMTQAERDLIIQYTNQ